MKKAAKPPELIALLKQAIVKLIETPDVNESTILKAIELGTKLAAIEAKIKDGDTGTGFFDK